jgi:Cu-Zn family superoxide dismutase
MYTASHILLKMNVRGGFMYRNNGNRSNFQNLSALMRQRPQAWATLSGAPLDPELEGTVRFYQTSFGVLVVAEISGLPNPTGACEAPIFGFHIHEGGFCTGNTQDPFSNVGNHYNPYDCPHPFHSGDLPPLFGSNGYAFSAFLTDRFTVNEIIGKAVIVHSMRDDFVSQPSGDAGVKIACGEIQR